MDAVEKFVADTLASFLKIKDQSQVAQLEAQVPAIVGGVMAVVALINVIRTATKPAILPAPPAPPK